MKTWVLANPPPVSEDTAYLLGRVTSRSSEVVVTQVGELDREVPPPPVGVEVILNRSFNTQAEFLLGLDALAERCGVRVCNPGAATLAACDKRSYIADYADVIPETRIAGSRAALRRVWEELGGDIVIKEPFGKHGKQVERLRAPADLPAAEALLAQSRCGELVAQRFCSGFLAGDKRVIVQRRPEGGYAALAWFQRVPRPGGWKSNVSAGGSVVDCDLSAEEMTLAEALAARSGLDYVGLDLARHERRTLLIETNSYTGGHVNFDIVRRERTGDIFAELIAHLASQGRS
ncbi:MAG: hypothetical protein WD489_08725 [Rhodovibrionaceae bacterium]